MGVEAVSNGETLIFFFLMFNTILTMLLFTGLPNEHAHIEFDPKPPTTEQV